MFVSTVITVYASTPKTSKVELDENLAEYIEHPCVEEVQDEKDKVQLRALLCGYCENDYIKDGTQINKQTINRYGNHTKMDGIGCEMSANHYEHVTHRTKISTCDSYERGT